MNYSMNIPPVHRPRMHDFRNVGRMIIDGAFLRESSYTLQQIYSQVIPTQVIYDGQSDLFSISGLSMHFRDVAEGEIIPEYDVIIHETPFGELIKFSEKKRGSYSTTP